MSNIDELKNTVKEIKEVVGELIQERDDLKAQLSEANEIISNSVRCWGWGWGDYVPTQHSFTGKVLESAKRYLLNFEVQE